MYKKILLLHIIIKRTRGFLIWLTTNNVYCYFTRFNTLYYNTLFDIILLTVYLYYLKLFPLHDIL